MTEWRANRAARFFLVFYLLLPVLLIVAQLVSPTQSQPYYFAGLLPCFMTLFALGLIRLLDAANGAIGKNAAVRIACATLLIGFSAGLNLRPAVLSAELRGYPPYKDMARWADAKLPAGTPIVCDRYFTAWNEMMVNAPTSVVFMSTVPNEPSENYMQNKWREHTIAFFQNNPDAAFEEGKMYWDQIGPWTWPQENFAHKASFMDFSALALTRIGLSYRSFSANYREDWLPAIIYYNTREDLLRRAAGEGRKTLALLGTGWKYNKTQDLRDWRVMGREATVDVFNLSSNAVDASLFFKGAAAGESKLISVGTNAPMSLPGGRLIEWHVATGSIPPGRSIVTISDPGWGTREVPLLLERVEAKEMP